MNMVEQVTDYVKNYDEEVGKAIELELGRQRRNLELIASENIISPAVMMAMATVPANKYAEGYPGKRYYGGCENVDIIENLAIERLKELFGCDHACVQPHSGANANNAVYQALIKPGDTVMGLNLAHGGHLTHGSPVNQSGILYNFVPYNINDDGVLDYDEIRKLAHECKPKMIVAGASAYPREIRFDIFADIAKEVGAYLFVDMAHIAGLVAAGLHQNPVPYADVVTTTTHKTLRGPRGGVIMCKEEHAKAINKAIFPGTQGGPLMHIIAAKAACFYEAMQPEFKEYANQVIKNAKALENSLKEEGFRLVAGGTDNHLLLIDVKTSCGISGKKAERLLDEINITANKNAIPFDSEKPFKASGIRVGTPAMTTKGFKEEDFIEVGKIIAYRLKNEETEEIKEACLRRVKTLTDKVEMYRDIKYI